jgi:hypothetical protein
VLHNQRPALLASTLPPNTLNLRPGERPAMICPDCGCWRLLYRSMIAAHQAADGITRCPGSGQRLNRDITPQVWQAQLRDAVQNAGRRRPSRVHLQPAPPVPTPVFRIRRTAA